MSHLNFSQQEVIFPHGAARPVTLIGIGAVGSVIATMLPRIGVRHLAVWDPKAVSSHQPVMSAYGRRDVGKFKTSVIAEIIEAQTGVVVSAHCRKYAGERLSGSVVCCVDDMEARNAVWTAVKDNPNVDVFVDTRVAVELVSVFATSPCNARDIRYYEHHLYSSEAAAKQTCGEHGTIVTSSLAASAACDALMHVWRGAIPERHFMMLGMRAYHPYRSKEEIHAEEGKQAAAEVSAEAPAQEEIDLTAEESAAFALQALGRSPQG